MNISDCIIQMAHNNGKRLRPQGIEEIRKDLPFLEVKRDSVSNRYIIEGHNYEGHDNAPRMQFVKNYLQQKIFPNVDSKLDLTGCYSIQLHDSYTYLNDGLNYDDVLVFAKDKGDANPVLLPDPFMMGNYGGRLDIKDPIPHSKKVDKIGFFGVTTGNKDPLQNERIKLCNWSVNNRDITDFYITGVVQMKPETFVQCYPEYQSFVRQQVPQDTQYNYKYLFSIDGNTASYDRFCWIMKSNSICFKKNSDEMLWYYPLLLEGTHFIGIDDHSQIRDKFNLCQNNVQYSSFINANAQKFVNDFITPIHTMLYTTYLFETVGHNRK
jgi:hypothetical protein